MKKIILCLIFICLMTGCSKTEQDESFNTKVYGKYSNTIETPDKTYQFKSSYTLYKDHTYLYRSYEKSNGNVKKHKVNGNIDSIQKINEDISKITFDEKIDNSYIQSPYNDYEYKYKNMLGEYDELDIPRKSKFNLFIKNTRSNLNEGLVFNKKGYYHYCTDYDDCTDDSKTFTKYKRKGNYIYQADSEGNWTILLYIVKDGLFSGVYTKEK